MFEWESEDGEYHHYRVGVEARLSDCTISGTGEIPEPCQSDAEPSNTKSALLENIMGERLFTYIGDIFLQKREVEEPLERNHCHLIHEFKYEEDLSDRLVFGTFGLILVSIIMVIVILCMLKRVAKKIYSHKRKVTIVKKTLISENKTTVTEKGKAQTSAVVSENTFSDTVDAPPKDIEKYSGISLAYQLNISSFHSQIPVKTLTSADFLSNATDKLYAELDKLLLKNANDKSTAQLALSTPRLARRVDRRGRIGSSPSLTVADHRPTVDDLSLDSKEKIEAWRELKVFTREMDWLEPYSVNVDETKLDRPGQRLLHYFHRVCPINVDQWEASVLIANFALFLLDKELKGLKSKLGYKCTGLKSTGSAKLGSKISKSNEFDVFMEVQPPDDIVPASVVEQAKSECIPPGRFLLSGKLRERSVNISSTMVSKTVKRIDLEGIASQFYLSSKEMATAAEELTDTCLQTLYSKLRSHVDRLPFQMKRAIVPNLVVSLDTKTLVGIGIPEIKINLIPVIRLPFGGWYQSVKLYATPILEVHEYKHRPETSNVICPDYFWQVAFGDINEIFQICVNDRMKHAGIDSCHMVCLMILKALLTGSVKGSLLDRGEHKTLHLSTCLNFLLLESQPEQWRFDQLVNRFSDCVHFLRDSFSNGRLPNFFINNPYLIEKMPFIRDLSLLSRKRQENLLSDMRTEALEKCVRFLEDSLRESGLAECVKEDYSNDMWEYEFFVFN